MDRARACTVLLMVLCVFGRTSSANVDKKFYLIANTTRGPERLSAGVSERSLLQCISHCLIRYTSICQSVMYDHSSHLCTPGKGLSPSQQVPLAGEGDLYVSEDELYRTTTTTQPTTTTTLPTTTTTQPTTSTTQPTTTTTQPTTTTAQPTTTTTQSTTTTSQRTTPPPCNAALGFELKTEGTTRVCVCYEQVKKSFTDALDSCIAKQSYLYTPKTQEKQDILESISGGKKAWIGLHDLDGNGYLQWTDKAVDIVDSSKIPNLHWSPGGSDDDEGEYYEVEDDDSRSETCIYFDGDSGLNDASCSNDYYFFCEQDL